MDIQLTHEIINDAYTEYVQNSYDIQDRANTTVIIPNNIDLPNDYDWNIGVIYGESGAGKTSILKSFGYVLEEPKFSDTASLISNFHWLSPESACNLLSSMGLASVPTWLRPYRLLSNGEKYRAMLAYMVSRPDQDPTKPILIDEYTSVVDRNVAKAMSNALGKYVRANGKKVILASCHFDIFEWLRTDWVYSPNKRRIERCDFRRQGKPAIKLEIFRCRYETWNLFKHHHYLTGDLNKAAKCFIALWDGKPVAFTAILPFPNGSFRNAFRVSRIVTLPDYQGLGIGFALNNYVASLYKSLGLSYYIRTSNPALVVVNQRNPEIWKETNNSGTYRRGQTMFSDGVKSFRTAYSFKYCGEPSNDDTTIISFEPDNKSSQKQIALFGNEFFVAKKGNKKGSIFDKENLDFDFGL